MSENKTSFEQSLNELEKIVQKLENGECSLDESIELFEAGMRHINDCRKALKTAEKRIVDLTQLEMENEADA